MTFNWKIPPWERFEDATHMAVLISQAGGGRASLIAEGVRGDDATEALADLLMGPGGVAAAVSAPGLIGVAVKRGIDVMWMSQPPIHAAPGKTAGEWDVSVNNADGAEVTVFSADQVRDLLAHIRAEYGAK